MPTRYLVFLRTPNGPEGRVVALKGLLVPQDGFQGSQPLDAGDFIFLLFYEQRPKAPALAYYLIIGSLDFFHVLVEVKEYLLTVLDG